MSRKLIWIALLIGQVNGAWAAKSPATPEDYSRTQGFVVVRLITNAAAVSVKSARFQDFSVVSRTQNGKVYYLGQSGFQLRAQVFGGWLPPGEYELQGLGAQAKQGLFTIGTGMELTGLLPPLQVMQGKRTDLGTLIFQPVGEGKAAVIHVESSVENTEAFAQSFPEDARVFVNAEPIVWNPGGPYRFDPRTVSVGSNDGLLIYGLAAFDGKRNRTVAKVQWAGAVSAAEMLALAKRATVQAYSRAEDAGGSFYVASSMGQILKRAPDGAWTNLDAGTLRDILGLYVDGKTIVAGSEDGIILTSRDGGATFAVATRTPDRGVVWSIDRLAADRWAVLSQTINGPDISTSIYFTSSFDSLPDTPAKTFAQHLGKISWSGFLPAATAAPGTSQYFVTVPPQ